MSDLTNNQDYDQSNEQDFDQPYAPASAQPDAPLFEPPNAQDLDPPMMRKNMLEIRQDHVADKNELIFSLSQFVTTQVSNECLVPVSTLRQLLEVVRDNELELKTRETYIADKEHRIRTMDRQMSETLTEISKFRVKEKVQEHKNQDHEVLLRRFREYNEKIDGYKKRVRIWAVVLTIGIIVSCGVAALYAGKYSERVTAAKMASANDPNYITKTDIAELNKLIQSNISSTTAAAQFESLRKSIEAMILTVKTPAGPRKENRAATTLAPGKTVTRKTVDTGNPALPHRAASAVPAGAKSADKQLMEAANSYARASSSQRGLLFVLSNEIILNGNQALANVIRQGMPVQSKVVFASHREVIGRLTGNNVTGMAVSIPMGAMRETVSSVCLQVLSDDASVVYTLECVTDPLAFIHINHPLNTDDEGMNQFVDLIKYRYNSKEAGELGKVSFRKGEKNSVITIRLNNSIREAISDGFLMEFFIGVRLDGKKDTLFTQVPLSSRHADTGIVEITLANVTHQSEIRFIELKANETSGNFGALNNGLNLPSLQSILQEEGASLQGKIASFRY